MSLHAWFVGKGSWAEHQRRGNVALCDSRRWNDVSVVRLLKAKEARAEHLERVDQVLD